VEPVMSAMLDDRSLLRYEYRCVFNALQRGER
jgi:hypothetical protein